MQLRRLLVLTILFITFYSQLKAQSNHYWTRNYGSESMLLSGSVVGGVTDLGAVYYNPARLALTDNPAFLISADVYELNTYTIKDAIGNQKDINKSSFGGAPSLAAGTIGASRDSKHTFAYAVLLRTDNNFSFAYRDEYLSDVLPNIPGDELFEGDINVENITKDHWFGGSWAYQAKSNLSFGLSLFGSRTELAKGNSLQLTALDTDNEVSSYQYNRNYSVKTYGFLAKFGMAYKRDKLDFGLTMTTPRVNLLGSADYGYNLYFAPTSASPKGDIYANSYQSDLDVTLKSPLSIGAGASYHFGKKKILHFSMEYFKKVHNYSIFEAEPHTMQSQPDSLVSFSLQDGLKSIMNMGVGAEWYISEKVSGYASFSTDFNAAPNDAVSFVAQREVASNLTFDANFFHLAGGVLLKFKGADFTLGATHTSGTTDFMKPTAFPDINDNTAPAGDQGSMLWNRWQFIVSVSVPFLKDYVKKMEEKIL